MNALRGRFFNWLRLGGRPLARSVVCAALMGGTLLAGVFVSAVPAQAVAPPSSALVKVPLNPVAGDEAFAQLRGSGYQQALGAAHQQATNLPSAPQIGSPSPSPTWAPIGPEPIANGYGGQNSGRITGLALSGSHIYVAAAGGGVWSSSNNGTSWTTNTDSQTDIAMGSVTVDPTIPADLFAGTGEDNSCGDCYFGAGILESTDGGSTWSLSNPGGMFTGVDISSIVVEPGAASLATTTVLAGGSNNLYVSTNGGTTWNAETGTGWTSGNVYSVVINPDTTPITIYAGVSGKVVEESADNGLTWSTPGGLPSGSSGAALAIAPNALATSTILYASVASTIHGYLGLFKSTNGGATWSQLTNAPLFTGDDYAYDGSASGDTGDQSWYDNALAIDPTNSNIVMAAGIALIETTDGGTTWTNLNGGGYFVPPNTHDPFFHPDFHAVEFDGSGDLYFGNDGGVWELGAAGVLSPGSVTASSFTNLNSNLDITQFYAGMDQTGNAATILAGSQDNGTETYNASGSPATTWNTDLTGDGGYDAIDTAHTNIQFAEADETLYKTTDGWNFTGSPVCASPACFTSANFVPPMAMVPGSSGPTVFFGADHVYRSTDGGSTFAKTATAYGGSLVSALAVAPSNHSVIYAGFNDGTLQMSVDGGSTWTTVVSIPTTEYITHISVNLTDPFTTYLSLGPASFQIHRANPVILVGSGLNATATWADVTGNLPSEIPANSVIPDGLGGLIAATDAGVFTALSLNGASTSWTRYGSGLPNVQVADILLNSNRTLIAETHGRGAWTIPFTPGVPSQLVFLTQPTTTVAGSSITPAPSVAIEDSNGNVVTTDNTDTVTVAIGTNPSSGTLSGTKTVTAASGVASFSGLSINKAGTGYTLSASSTAPGAATSSAFNIVPGVASQLVFQTQPSNTTAGSSITPAPSVAIEDSNGNVITSDSTDTVTVAIGTNPSSGTLSGSTTLTVGNGVASFANLSINKAGTGYTLSASSTAPGTALSNAFNIGPGIPTQLVFLTQPTTTTAGSSITPAPSVAIEDSNGNVVTTDSTDTVTLSIGTNPGSGTLSGTKTVTAVNGVASFANLSINKVGTGYTLSASSTAAGVGTKVSTTFNITVGAASQLVFATSPSSSTSGVAFGTQPVVDIEDSSGNVVTSDSTDTVTVAIGTNPSSGTLSGTKTVTAANGVASFSGLSINKAGSGYTLSASSSAAGVGTKVSTAFNINASPPPGRPQSKGYWLVASDGGIFSFGDAQFFGSTGSLVLNKPIVGMAATPDHGGYWLVASDGGIFTFGDAAFFGSTGSLVLNKPIVTMAATPDGGGYWLVASDGGVFTFGDAQFFGSTGALHLNRPIVGMAPTADGKGYWLVASDGGIFAFGDATFFGSTGAIVLNKPVVGMAPTADGNGYWLVASDGGIFAFGDATFFGSTGAIVLNKPMVGMAPTNDGNGYWLVASDGGVFSFGDAQFFGSTGSLVLNKPIVAMAGTT